MKCETCGLTKDKIALNILCGDCLPKLVVFRELRALGKTATFEALLSDPELTKGLLIK